MVTVLTETLAKTGEAAGHDVEFISRDLHDFYLILPWDDFHPGGGLLQKLALEGGLMDKKFCDIDLGEGITQQQDGMSDLKWNQTPRQFFRAVNRAMSETKADIFIIRRLQHRLYSLLFAHPDEPMMDGTAEIAVSVIDKINELAFPIYKALLSLGYNDQDLSVVYSSGNPQTTDISE